MLGELTRVALAINWMSIIRHCVVDVGFSHFHRFHYILLLCVMTADQIRAKVMFFHKDVAYIWTVDVQFSFLIVIITLPSILHYLFIPLYIYMWTAISVWGRLEWGMRKELISVLSMYSFHLFFLITLHSVLHYLFVNFYLCMPTVSREHCGDFRDEERGTEWEGSVLWRVLRVTSAWVVCEAGASCFRPPDGDDESHH